jgi:ABC-2 type transport system permease protein
MLSHVIEKELKDCLYGYRSLLILILSVVLFSLAIYTGARRYQGDLQEYRLAEASLRQTLSDEITLYALSTFVFNVVKPPAMLGILVGGADLLSPRVYNFRLYTLPTPQGSAVSESPTVAVFGPLDLPFVVEAVLGLAALLFTFAAISGEKETGTLKLQLANALPKDTLLLGKLVGNLLGLLVPVAMAFVIACLLLAGFSDVALSSEVLWRILLLTVDFFLYLTVFFALGLCISTFTTRSTTAFGVCLVAWVLLVAMVPKLAVIAANQLSPIEPLQEFEMKKADVDRRGSLRLEQEAQKYKQEHNNARTVSQAVATELLKKVREEQNAELDRLADDHALRKERQARLALLLSRLSPAGSASYAAMNLAGTSLERDFHFRKALARYREQFTAYYDSKAEEIAAVTGDQPANSTVKMLRVTDLPPFQFADEPAAEAIDRALPDMGLLAVWALALFVAAYFRFARYDVR